MPGAVVLLAEIMDIGPILGKALGAGLQLFESEALRLIPGGDVRGLLETAADGTAEVFLELRVLDPFQPIICIGHHLVTAGSEDISW